MAASTEHEEQGVSAGSCPVCGEVCSFAGGRGFCRDCFITFPMPRVPRAKLLESFQLRYFVSKQTGVYHREGCKYLKNAAPENIVVTTEPYGRACGCVKARA